MVVMNAVLMLVVITVWSEVIVTGYSVEKVVVFVYVVGSQTVVDAVCT